MLQRSGTLCLAVLHLASRGCGAVVVSNVVPLRDVNGEIVKAKDGEITFFGGEWLMWGMSYGDCLEPPGKNGCRNTSLGECGFRLTHTIRLYTSPDLSSGSWRPVSSNVLPIEKRPAGIYFAPKVRWNARTKRWVLWINYLYEPALYGFFRSQYLVATSEVPEGPFTVESTNVTVLSMLGGAGDFDLLVDDDPDATGYIIYTSRLLAPTGMDHVMSVERLSPDYLTSTHESSGFFGDPHVEAPVFFKRKGVYYAFFDSCCCFCGQGSGVVVHTATHPLGPWTPGPQIGKGADHRSVPRAQQRGVFWYPSEPPTVIWHGQRWQSAPDRRKDHDFATWLPLDWTGTDGSAIPIPKQMQWLDNFTLGPKGPVDLQVGSQRFLRGADGRDLQLQLSESSIPNSIPLTAALLGLVSCALVLRVCKALGICGNRRWFL